MEFTKAPGFGERFTFPENVEITINGDTISTMREAAVRVAERWEEAVVCEIVKEARMAGYTEATVLNKEVILEALRRYVMPPKTNADRIRAMTDEELGIFLGEWADKPWSWKRDGEGECLAWLQQPAEDL